MATEIETLLKQPGETRLFAMSFKNKLTTGETITTVDSIVISPSGELTGVEHSITPTEAANILFSGGVADRGYRVTITVSTTEGQILENDGILMVEEK